MLVYWRLHMESSIVNKQLMVYSNVQCISMYQYIYHHPHHNTSQLLRVR